MGTWSLHVSFSLPLSLLHTLSTPLLSDVMLLCTVSAAHPLLQMSPLAVSSKLGLYVSINTTDLPHCLILVLHTTCCIHSLTHLLFLSPYTVNVDFQWGLIKCDTRKADMKTEGQIPCLDFGIIIGERTQKDKIKKRIRAAGPY